MDAATNASPRKLCRTAVIGAVLSGLHLLFGPLGLMLLTPLVLFLFAGASGPLMAPRAPMLAPAPWMLGAVWLSGLLGLLGMGFSIRSWIVIARSRGRLYGLWLAVPGTLAPLLCSSPVLSWVYLVGLRWGP